MMVRTFLTNRAVMLADTRNTKKSVEVGPVQIAHNDGDAASIHYQDPCAMDDLEVRNLSDHEWRVGDRRCHERSPAKVLGYIEKRGPVFEVLNIREPRLLLIFDRFQAAVASFAAPFPT